MLSFVRNCRLCLVAIIIVIFDIQTIYGEQNATSDLLLLSIDRPRYEIKQTLDLPIHIAYSVFRKKDCMIQ